MPAKSDTRKYRINDWSGGLNLKDSSFVVADNELVDSRNISLSTRGAIRVIRGNTRYETGANDHLDPLYRTPIKGMYRYGKSTGEREVIIHNAQGMIFVDGGDRTFSLLKGAVGDTGLWETSDGFMRYAQWKDTVYFLSDRQTPNWYHSGGVGVLGTSNVTGVCDLAPTRRNIFSVADGGTGSGELDSTKYFTYRYTLDIYRGDDFVSESLPLGYPDPRTIFDSQYYYDQSLSNGITGATEIHITVGNSPSGNATIFEGLGAKYINIYRREASSTISYYTESNEFYKIASIPLVDYNNMNTGDVLYRDNGHIIPYTGKMIYDVCAKPPRAKFGTSHKNRMWYLDCTAYNINGTDQDSHHSRLYYSEYDKPESVRIDSWVGIGPQEGEKPTGIVSWKNKVLLIFKPNSIWAVYGGDNEAQYKGENTGLLDIQIEQISGDIGCIAPGTLSMGENAIFFLSNRGVYYFDGTVPKSLNTEMVNEAFKRVPSHRKYYATGEYINYLREYRIAISDSAVDPNRNRVVLKYDFYTNTWIRHEYDRVSVNDFVEFERGDEIGDVLMSNDDTSALLISNGSLMRLESSTYDVLTTSGVPWSAKTKFFDCGDPETIKQFFGIMVFGEFPQGLTIGYNIDSGDVTGTLTVASSGTAVKWNAFKWNDGTKWQGSVQGDRYVRFADTDIGKRIQFEFSGTAGVWPTEIQGITIFYKTKERIGNV